ncbi:hypothetical protein PMKS-003997 [Pichia membranifaciens]|uniref:Tubulin-specific chaperone A n=1 Tax=Pichia membranifaciens TaxID=4926 RepID=A0A1Q2YM83_9ASCO|nr:hypothetical protein PMKS-003997 [Pichia membranifaciens]
MSPTDKEIKVAALARLLQDRTSYIQEVEDKEKQLKDTNKQDGKNKNLYSDFNVEIILQETKDLIPLVEAKIKEVADDIRGITNGESSDVVNRLLSEADHLGQKI